MSSQYAATLEKSIDRLHDQNADLRAEVERLRDALRRITGCGTDHKLMRELAVYALNHSVPPWLADASARKEQPGCVTISLTTSSS